MDPINQTTQSNINPTPASPQNPMTVTAAPKKVGPIVTVLVIVLIVIIGGLYLFASKINKQAIPDDIMTAADNSSQSVQPVTNSSDNILDIQSDLNASTNGVDNQSF